MPSEKIEARYKELMLGLPNLPDRDLGFRGNKENNEPLRYFGEPQKFDFRAQNHVDICTELGLVDYKRGVKLSGNGFWVYRGLGRKARMGAAQLFHRNAPFERI